MQLFSHYINCNVYTGISRFWLTHYSPCSGCFIVVSVHNSWLINLCHGQLSLCINTMWILILHECIACPLKSSYDPHIVHKLRGRASSNHIHHYLITYLHTPWSRVLEKLTGFQTRNSPHFMDSEGSLPHSQLPANCPYLYPAQSSPYPHIQLPEDPS